MDRQRKQEIAHSSPTSRRRLSRRCSALNPRSCAGSKRHSSILDSASEDPRWLIEPECAKKSDVIKNRRGNQQHAIKPIEQTAVTWDRCSHVLDSDIPLD